MQRAEFAVRLAGLLADNAWDNARIDMVVDSLDDMRVPIVKILFPPDEETKVAIPRS